MTLKDLIERLEDLRAYGELTDVEVNDCKVFDVGYDSKENIIYIEN